MPATIDATTTAFGFIPCLATPRADYHDFPAGFVFGYADLAASLSRGVLPPGLLIRRGNIVYQVWGAYEQPQKLILSGVAL